MEEKMNLTNKMARILDNKKGKKYVISVAIIVATIIMMYLCGTRTCQMQRYTEQTTDVLLLTSMSPKNPIEIKEIGTVVKNDLSTMAEMCIEDKLNSKLKENKQLYSLISSEENYIKALAMLEQADSNMNYIKDTMKQYEELGYFASLKEEISQSDEEFFRVQEVFNKLQDRELYRIAKLIHGEGSVCDSEEKYCIASVAVNRLERDDFPNSIEKIIKDGYDYKKDKNISWKEEPTNEELRIAEDVLVNGNRVFPIEVVFQSQGYIEGKIVKRTEHHVYSAKEYLPKE